MKTLLCSYRIVEGVLGSERSGVRVKTMSPVVLQPACPWIREKQYTGQDDQPCDIAARVSYLAVLNPANFHCYSQGQRISRISCFLDDDCSESHKCLRHHSLNDKFRRRRSSIIIAKISKRPIYHHSATTSRPASNKAFIKPSTVVGKVCVPNTTRNMKPQSPVA